ncbi:MAG: c-type cytochrome [Bacteroidetes bacterium]|nr:c-type cytochrome [Bacteroidota bacterium]
MLFVYSCSSNLKRDATQQSNNTKKQDTVLTEKTVWKPNDTLNISNDTFGSLVKYGRELLLNTPYYIGPNGTVSKNLGNIMTCSNCHLSAGTVPFGFNFFSSHARYPQYRAREDKILTLADRVNNCIERPHSGKPLALNSKEMIAIVSYIKWLGSKTIVGEHVYGDSPMPLDFPNRAANPEKGENVYIAQCLTCHGKSGEGKLNEKNTAYIYPPLWGPQSYQKGSSMHRITKAASFIYCNMPQKVATYQNPKLSVEEAFDVAAFINDDRIHPRPYELKIIDYPNLKHKPIDFGTGPYIDSFPQLQHKFGPFKPIKDWYLKHGLEIH